MGWITLAKPRQGKSNKTYGAGDIISDFNLFRRNELRLDIKNAFLDLTLAKTTGVKPCRQGHVSLPYAGVSILTEIT